MASAPTPTDMGNWIQQDVDETSAALAIRLAAGWIIGATSFADMPGVVTDDVWSAWLELATIAYDNPTSMTSNQAGEEISMWAGGSQERRAAILVSLSEKYPRLTAQPLGSFEAPDDYWPDDARVTRFGRLRGWVPWH